MHHPKTIDRSEPWMAEAARYFPFGNSNGIRFPASALMVSENHKILYAPIAKCGCTSLKTLIAKISDIDHKKRLLKLGVHNVTDNFNTGLHLQDLPLERARDVVESDAYFKFSVIREPVSRTISAYIDKFVRNRMDPVNQMHTCAAIQAIQGSDEPDYVTGVSFRQFVEYLIERAPSDHDSHWAPQHLFLQGVPHYDKVYRIDQTALLKQDLEKHTGVRIPMERLNSNDRGQRLARTVAEPGIAVDLLPTEIQKRGLATSIALREPAVTALLEAYFKEDLSLFKSTSEGPRPYSPTLVEFPRSASSLKAQGQSGGVWEKLNLFSKGYVALNRYGKGKTGLVILNHSSLHIDQVKFPELALEYFLIDRQGNKMSEQPVAAQIKSTIPALGSLQFSLAVEVPIGDMDRVLSVQMRLVTRACKDNPAIPLLHSASAAVIPWTEPHSED